MKLIQKLQRGLEGVTNAFLRFPITILFLAAATVISIYSQTNDNVNAVRLLFSCGVGAALTALMQVIYERFFKQGTSRVFLILGGILLSAVYYIFLLSSETIHIGIGYRTGILLFALFTAFILVPVIKSEFAFHDNFMISFKAVFISGFFSLVLYLGLSIIYLAVDNLLFDIGYKIYGYTSSVVFIFFMPVYFLSIIPDFIFDSKEKERREEDIKNVISFAKANRYLEVLISYIIIPLVMVFTIILVLYIIINVGGDFFTKNMLEPLIVIYSVTVIIVYLLGSDIQNKITIFFRNVFPKVLVPLVLIQTIASIYLIGDTGITYGRYFAILYGVFSIITGIIFSILPVKKNGYVAVLFILFSVISITPPVDAFSVSINSQAGILEKLLVKNKMVNNNQIIPNNEIPEDDKTKIIKAAGYLYGLDAEERLSYLPKGGRYPDFDKIFGFSYGRGDDGRYVSISLSSDYVPITGYDVLLDLSFYIEKEGELSVREFTVNNEKYTIIVKDNGDEARFIIKDSANQEIVSISISEILAYYNAMEVEGKEVGLEEATFTGESEKMKATLIIRNLNYRIDSSETVIDYKDISSYLLIQMK